MESRRGRGRRLPVLGPPVRLRASAVIVTVMALSAGCGGEKKEGVAARQASLLDGPEAMRSSGIYGVPVPATAELDKAASPQGTETYRVKDVDLQAFYDRKMPMGRRFNGLDYCGTRVIRPQPPGPPTQQLVWRKRGTKDLLLLGVSARAGTVTIVDARNDPKPPCR